MRIRSPVVGERARGIGAQVQADAEVAVPRCLGGEVPAVLSEFQGGSRVFLGGVEVVARDGDAAQRGVGIEELVARTAAVAMASARSPCCRPMSRSPYRCSHQAI